MYAALVLLSITLAVNVIGTAIVARADAPVAGARDEQPADRDLPGVQGRRPRPARDARCDRRARCSARCSASIAITAVARGLCPAVLRADDARVSRRIAAELGGADELPPAALASGGGFGNAIVGTLMMVGIATLLSVPCGILAASYLAPIGPRHATSHVVRFVAKVLTGLPSVLAGVFAYAAVVLVDRRILRAGRRRGARGADDSDGAADRRGGDQDGAGAA